MPGSWRIVQIKILGVFSQVRTCTCQHWLSISSFTTRKIFNTLLLELSQQSFWAEFSQPWRPCCMHPMANLVIASSSNKSKNTWKVSIGRLIRLSCMLIHTLKTRQAWLSIWNDSECPPEQQRKVKWDVFSVVQPGFLNQHTL